MIVKILDTNIDSLTHQELFARIENIVAAKIPSQIATVNPEFLIEAQKNKRFKKALQEAELKIADGIGIRAAATFLSLKSPRWQPLKIIVCLFQGLLVGIKVIIRHEDLKNPIPETITGTDLVDQLSAHASKKSWKIFLLGGNPNTAQLSAQALTQKHPGLQIVGVEEGIPKEVDWESKQGKDLISALVKRIGNRDPDILFIAFGAPKQNIFIDKYKQELNVPIMMGVGGAFDFISGQVKRAPYILRTLGVEWLWRLIVQPWRWKRIFTATIVFPWRVFLSRIS